MGSLHLNIEYRLCVSFFLLFLSCALLWLFILFFITFNLKQSFIFPYHYPSDEWEILSQFTPSKTTLFIPLNFSIFVRTKNERFEGNNLLEGWKSWKQLFFRQCSLLFFSCSVGFKSDEYNNKSNENVPQFFSFPLRFEMFRRQQQQQHKKQHSRQGK